MWLNLIVLVVSAIISYLLRPQVKQENPAFEDMENPTADAGRPIPVVFGTLIVKSPNILWYGDKEFQERSVAVDKK